MHIVEMTSRSQVDDVLPALPQTAGSVDGALLWRAPAKLNLTLRVLGKRADGYHDLDSLVAKITLYDELVFRPQASEQVSLEVIAPFDCGPIEQNLVYRAARLMQDAAPAGGPARGVHIVLRKNIPAGGGLGGGSSDAAAALLALNRLWDLKLPPERLAELGAQLGSDVPLFLGGKSSRIGGRGERVAPVEVSWFFALLCLSGLHCSTPQVYAAHDSALQPCPPTVGMPELFGPASQWRERLFNDLQPAAMAVCPPLAELAAKFGQAIGLPVHLTGSGSALFAVVDSASQAASLLAALPDSLRKMTLAVGLNPW
jgi:4-diphosphocytidyl-2-C-methyl-D-erythritol kinase